ncbi:zinc-dependent alcohol dehydrogenase family protein [Mesorhizobium sp. BAC0120]|uniref:zinc-dependent alcohol dehydrogenase family protein n=1 Tax=Mesorhizobium sp. BAC0120 TaxID=3090670 RepID=UPI00298BE8D6|nr:zinc-dependent alcohol dehydrogenase family protein [Mesorhizobium sp. BAC0120]MDW6026332.1 zinc-dependent alcohol dehydrogenase family protein [Mesorhizobium sp. BAC0120]
MEIRAAVLEESELPAPYSQSKPLKVRQVELAGPGQGEVLVRIVAAGLCHSDLSVIDGSRPRPLPMVLGHEAAGVVEELGPGVTDLVVGDHVVCVFVPSCGTCEYCCEGRPALCRPGAAANGRGALLSGARRLSSCGCDQNHLNHHLGVSAFAQYATVARQSLVKIDRELDLKFAALFGCAVLTGVGAVLNSAHIRAGDTVAIIGLGGVGMAALLGARAAGAERIVAIDISEPKLQWARELGATDVFLAGEDVDEVRDATNGGLDHALEFAGSLPALQLGYRIIRRGGTLVTAGLPPPTTVLPIPAVGLVADEKAIRGSYLGSCVPSRDIPRYIRLFQRGLLPVDRLLTSEFSLEDINTGFDQLREAKLLRGLVTRFG